MIPFLAFYFGLGLIAVAVFFYWAKKTNPPIKIEKRDVYFCLCLVALGPAGLAGIILGIAREIENE